MYIFKVYKDRACEYRWKLQARNGRIICDGGEGYKRKRNCIDAICKIIKAMRRLDYRIVS